MRSNSILCFFFFVCSIGIAQNQSYYSLHLTKEFQKKQVSVYARDSDVFFFESGVLINKIPKGEIKKILVRNDKSNLYSTKKIFSHDLAYHGNGSKTSFLSSRITPMPKMMKNEKILSFWFVLILIVLSMIRTQNIDVFIGFVVPWVAYSNTIEIVGKMNARAILLPISFFLLCVFSLIWMFNPLYDWLDLGFSFLLIIILFVFKVFILNVLEFLFDFNGFAKKYLLLFLKQGVFFALMMFVLRFLEILNSWDFIVVYKFLLFLYIIVWLVSLIVNFNREPRRKLMYFFSYICIAEALPIIFVIASWKN